VESGSAPQTRTATREHGCDSYLRQLANDNAAPRSQMPARMPTQSDPAVSKPNADGQPSLRLRGLGTVWSNGWDTVGCVDLVLLIGIPATGKTTFCASELGHSHLRISRDVLGTVHREHELFATALRTTTRIVIDDTNVTRADRARFIRPAREAGYTVRGFFFESRRRDALVRNSVRDERDRVPDVAIGDKSNRLELPSREEGFDELWFVRIDASGGFVTEESRDEVR
jgi:predicted kinase